MTDITKAGVVVTSYVKMLRTTGHYSRTQVPTHGKTLQNCVNFFDASCDLNVGVYPMMLVGFHMYSKNWLEKTFNKSYPPFNIITGPRCLAWIRSQMPKSIQSVNVDEVANSIMKMLITNNIERNTALDLVNSGIVCGENSFLREALLRRLK